MMFKTKIKYIDNLIIYEFNVPKIKTSCYNGSNEYNFVALLDADKEELENMCRGDNMMKKLKEEVNAVILSPDEATYDLINNEQGEFYNIFCERLLKYMNKKCIEIVNSGANVIYERGLWSKEERQKVKQYFEENNIETELHYIHVSDENWKKQIEERNKRVESGKGGADFYLDEGLMKKLVSKFEEPTEDEVDVWYENDYMSRKQK